MRAIKYGLIGIVTVTCALSARAEEVTIQITTEMINPCNSDSAHVKCYLMEIPLPIEVRNARISAATLFVGIEHAVDTGADAGYEVFRISPLDALASGDSRLRGARSVVICGPSETSLRIDVLRYVKACLKETPTVLRLRARPIEMAPCPSIWIRSKVVQD